jgi:hypothetical protein
MKGKKFSATDEFNNVEAGIEFNVEGYATKSAAQYPYEEGSASCKKFHKHVWALVEFNIAKRATRLKRQRGTARK